MLWVTLILVILGAAAGEPPAVRMGPGMEVPRTPETVAAGVGEPLLVVGTVRRADHTAAADVTLSAWQANAQGRYGPNPQQQCCYLQATVKTDRAGRYALQTIVPGAYEGSQPHIHLDVGGVMDEIVVDGRPDRIRHDVVLP